MSWDPVVVTIDSDEFHPVVAWSPCSRFISIVNGGAVEILDAVTLSRLNTLERPHHSQTVAGRSFSSDGHFLTGISDGKLLSWNLQTGGPVDTILSELGPDSEFFSTTCSMDGKMFAAAYKGSNDTSIDTYDLLSRTHKGSYRVSEGRVIDPIWTHGDRLRFATTKGGCITIWEAVFALTHPPAEVTSFLTPDGTDDAKETLFLPTPTRLGLTFADKVSVWDAATSKFLLKSGLIPVSDAVASPLPGRFGHSSFSSDGRFFASMTDLPDVCVWRESPNGYTLCRRLVPTNLSPYLPRAFLSPNGGSIVMIFINTIHLWHTMDQTPLSTSTIPTERERGWYSFIMEFSPDGMLAGFVRTGGKVITILDLQSGDPRAVIDTGMSVNGLGLVDSTVAVIGQEGKIVTWRLPAGNHTQNSRVNTNDNIQITTLGTSTLLRLFSMSSDLSRVAVTGPRSSDTHTLQVYDAPTGRCLAAVTVPKSLHSLRFTPNGREIWSTDYDGRAEGWEIPQDGESDLAELKSLGQAAHPHEVIPWQSNRNHEITDDGWVLSPTQKRLLWLPRYWRLDKWRMTWSGQYLGLRYGDLPEVVILEFPE